MMLLAEVELELDEKGILAQIEITKEALFQFSQELCELDKMLRKACLKKKGNSEESPKS